jgi:hypothetical protein
MNYYYLAASLPAVAMGAVPPMDLEAFRNLCSEHLSPRDARALSDLLERDDGPESSHPFVRSWRNRDTRLRNALARLRGQRLQKDAAAFIREAEGFDAQTVSVASEAFAKSDPLQRERAIDAFRWQLIEELAGYNPFAGRAILAYALKLRLAERWAALKEQEGQATAKTIIEQEPEEKPQ